MNGKQLLDWLEEIEKAYPGTLQDCKVFLETPHDNGKLITAHVYDENEDGKLDTIYLIHK
jgi:hypothetical protein